MMGFWKYSLASYAVIPLLEKGRTLKHAKSIKVLSFPAGKSSWVASIWDKQNFHMSIPGLNKGECRLVRAILASADYTNLTKIKTIAHLKPHCWKHHHFNNNCVHLSKWIFQSDFTLCHVIFLTTLRWITQVWLVGLFTDTARAQLAFWSSLVVHAGFVPPSPVSSETGFSYLYRKRLNSLFKRANKTSTHLL